MSPADALDKLRADLDKVGQERAKQEKAERDLVKRATRLFQRGYGKLSVAEMARRTGLHRTTVYRVYDPTKKRKRR